MMQIKFNIVDGAMGKTLTTVQNIEMGQTIWANNHIEDELGVKCLTLEEIQELPEDERKTFEMYCWQVSKNTWEGTPASPEVDPVNYINHSCNPNMHFTDDDTITARRNIVAGEALSLEYATCDTIYAVIENCLCKSSNCRGKVTSTDAFDSAIIKTYGANMRSCLK